MLLALHSQLSKLLKSLSLSLRKSILGNIDRVSLQSLLLLLSKLKPFLERVVRLALGKYWPENPSHVKHQSSPNPGYSALEGHNSANSCSAVHLPLNRVSSVPQKPNDPHPSEKAGHYGHLRPHVSLPNLTAFDFSNMPARESESPIRIEPDGGAMSVLKGKNVLSHPRIRPLVPETLERYDRNVKISKKLHEYTILPLTTSFDMSFDPPGWTPCFHPEGALYFFHKEKRIFTDTNLYEADMLSQIHSDIEVIEDFFRSNDLIRSKDSDLVLDLKKSDNGIDTLYYLIDHSTRCVFYIDKLDASDFPIWNEVKGVRSPTHVKHLVEANYWYHCLMFPTSIELSANIVQELRDLLIHSVGDRILSLTSVIAYTVDELEKMLNLATSVEACIGSNSQGSICFLSTVMFVFARQRFYNFHGQPGARMGRDQSVYGDTTNKRSWMIHLISPILFFAPEVHLYTLEQIWIDGIIRKDLWTTFIAKLNADWQEFTLYATVVLNANVAFLAIQSVDSSGHGNARSPEQIASYISIATSIGSIILGLLLVRQSRSKDDDNVTEVSVFLHRRHNQALGMESLAIMYSLPYALLMWGMVCFLIAFLFLCFDSSDIYTRLLVGATWGSIVFFIVCCIWMVWDGMPSMPVFMNRTIVAKEEDDSGEKSTEEDKRGQILTMAWRLQGMFRRGTGDSDATVV